MSYVLQFTSPGLDPSKAPITVPVGTVNTTATPLNLTGKGAGNYAGLQQENLLHILENFASSTAPAAPTIGQLWYDSSSLTLKVLVDVSPVTWKSLGGLQVTATGDGPPSPAALGDLWFERTGVASGFLYTYTGIGRYPQTATTIGGWDQIYPGVETYAGRDEYDSMREMLEQIAGESTSAYGSGALGRSITNLTDFGPLDNDLRIKYSALGPDANVLASTTADISFAKQALSTTSFFHADVDSANPGRAKISGSATDVNADGSIYLAGAVTPLTAGDMFSSQQYEDAYIMWDSADALGTGRLYQVVRFDEVSKQFMYDNNTAWTTFTPSADQRFIGTTSTFQGSGFPGQKNGFIWATAVPLIGIKISSLKVEPNSQDWDSLLAAAKYAIARLEVPSHFVSAVAGSPFVIDGRQAPTSLTSLAVSDIRYPTAARRSNRKVGAVTQVQNFTETVNALQTAIASRFSLRGINGASGTNPTFAPTTTITNHMSASGVVGSGVGDIRVQFRFTNSSELARWLASGQGLQLEVTHVGGAGAGDTQLRALLAQYGTWRLTADKTRFFGQSLPLTASAATVNSGLWNATTGGVTLASQTVGPASMTVTAYRPNPTGDQIDVLVAFNAGAALAGTTTVAFKSINDTETYLPGPTNVYSSPQPFVSGDITNAL